MIIYLSRQQAIINMHERGFVEDFQLFGNNLLWVQGKIFIRSSDFVITEYHRFPGHMKKKSEEILFGVIVLNSQLKGILLNDYRCYTITTPVIISRKLREMNVEYYQE